MNFVILVFSLFIFYSCSSTPVKEKELSPIDKEFAWIENNDFIHENEIPFVPHDDVFEGEDSKFDTLSTESIERLPEPKLDNISESKSPVSSAIAYCYKRDFLKAFKILDKAYKKYKGHPSFWNVQASCYFLKRDKRKALLYYNKTLAVKPNYAPALNNIGVLYWRDQKYQKALLAFEKAKKYGKFSLTPSFNMASLYLKFGLVSKAKLYFSQLYKKNSRDQDVINSLATIYMIEGRFKESIQFFDALEDEYKELPHSGLNFSLVLKLVGRTRDAKSIFKDVKVSNYPQYKSYALKVGNYIGI